MADCVTCRYWSERLEDVRIRSHGVDRSTTEKVLMSNLKTHQSEGACAARFPMLLTDLIDGKACLSAQSEESHTSAPRER
jgi:hypothetical protein